MFYQVDGAGSSKDKTAEQELTDKDTNILKNETIKIS
jgi:hypothetical protein